jgi:hypothetical protein
MSRDRKPLREADRSGNKLIVDTDVFHQGERVSSHIWLPAHFIDRITDKALAGGIDGYVGEDT